MSLPTFTMQQLIEAGAHFGHHTRRWNPKMESFLFGVRNGIHIIDLQQTMPMLYRAMVAMRDVASKGGRVLFVGTKRQAQERIAAAAGKCGQYYINQRWLGGTMTNWKTVSASIKRMKQFQEQLASPEAAGYTKKELLELNREIEKLERSIGGIKEMGGLPDMLFVIDTNKEDIAIKEAQKLGIPIIAVVDSNSDPVGIDYPIPGNDDAIRAIDLYCELMAAAVLDGIKNEMVAAGVDLGALDNVSEDAEAAA